MHTDRWTDKQQLDIQTTIGQTDKSKTDRQTVIYIVKHLCRQTVRQRLTVRPSNSCTERQTVGQTVADRQ